MNDRFIPRPPIVIGLTGGVASGKSTVAALFAECGLAVVDADRIAREVAGEAPILAALRARFGDRVFESDGGLDRGALAALVFRDTRARTDLEAILHPPIRARIREALDSARAVGASVLLDAPLLIENGLDALCDQIVHVDVPRAVRLARAKARGWDEAEFARREAAQAPLAVKKSRATATIDNAGSLETTRTRVRELLATLARRRSNPDHA